MIGVRPLNFEKSDFKSEIRFERIHQPNQEY